LTVISENKATIFQVVIYNQTPKDYVGSENNPLGSDCLEIISSIIWACPPSVLDSQLDYIIKILLEFSSDFQ